MYSREALAQVILLVYMVVVIALLVWLIGGDATTPKCPSSEQS